MSGEAAADEPGPPDPFAELEWRVPEIVGPLRDLAAEYAPGDDAFSRQLAAVALRYIHNQRARAGMPGDDEARDQLNHYLQQVLSLRNALVYLHPVVERAVRDVAIDTYPDRRDVLDELQHLLERMLHLARRRAFHERLDKIFPKKRLFRENPQGRPKTLDGDGISLLDTLAELWEEKTGVTPKTTKHGNTYEPENEGCLFVVRAMSIVTARLNPSRFEKALVRYIYDHPLVQKR